MPDKVTIQEILRKIEGVVTEMKAGFTDNQVSLDNLTSKVTDLTDSVEMAHELVKEVQDELTKQSKEKKELSEKILLIELENKNLKVEMSRLKERVIDGENRNRRNCLEMEGVSQDANETNATLEKKILLLFERNLKLDIKNIQTERCHRFGYAAQGKPRPVIVRFLSYKMRQKVWLNKNLFKGTKFTLMKILLLKLKKGGECFGHM